MEKNERTYNLKITARQAQVIREAMEAYSRLLHGQIDMVVHDMFRDRFGKGAFSYQACDVLCRQLKQMVFPELEGNSEYGVGSKVYPQSDIAWDLNQVIRHRLAWDRTHDEGKDEPDHFSTWDYPPMRFGEEPLATIEEAESRKDQKC